MYLYSHGDRWLGFADPNEFGKCFLPRTIAGYLLRTFWRHPVIDPLSPTLAAEPLSRVCQVTYTSPPYYISTRIKSMLCLRSTWPCLNPDPICDLPCRGSTCVPGRMPRPAKPRAGLDIPLPTTCCRRTYFTTSPSCPAVRTIRTPPHLPLTQPHPPFLDPKVPEKATYTWKVLPSAPCSRTMLLELSVRAGGVCEPRAFP